MHVRDTKSPNEVLKAAGEIGSRNKYAARRIDSRRDRKGKEGSRRDRQ